MCKKQVQKTHRNNTNMNVYNVKQINFVTIYVYGLNLWSKTKAIGLAYHMLANCVMN